MRYLALMLLLAVLGCASAGDAGVFYYPGTDVPLGGEHASWVMEFPR